MRQRSELRSYQHRVIGHLYENDEAMAVLKMGAGKTVSTLTAIAELIQDRHIRHALVIAPKRVATSVWPAEIAEWAHTRHLRFAVLDRTPAHRKLLLDEAGSRDVTIIGIDNVQWLCEQLKDKQDDNPLFDCLVIDETSRLKDPKSKRAKALARVAGRFRIRWGLTGTPMPNSLLDLFTPTKIITDGKLWGKSFYKWQSEHFYPADRMGYTWKVLPGDHEANLLADAASIAIALNEGDMPDLPEISFLVDEIMLPDDVRQIYNDMEHHLIADVGKDNIFAATSAVATGKLAEIVNGFLYGAGGNSDVHRVHEEKSEWLGDLVDRLDGEPAIVVYEYKEDLAMIRRLFGDLPYLGAGVSDAQANDAIARWNRGELPLFALHPASGGHGLNLQNGGARMLWISPPWSPEYWDQTCSRIHRPGQLNHVMIHICLAAGTVDELKRLRVLGKLDAQQAFERYLASRAVARAA
jgi:SNF2 family DNA or RNA helicase